MLKHKHATKIDELVTYLNLVIDRIGYVFENVEKEICGLEWGRLNETYHNTPYKSSAVSISAQELLSEVYVKKHRSVFEYILVSCKTHFSIFITQRQGALRAPRHKMKL
jgi:hypothetical protein